MIDHRERFLRCVNLAAGYAQALERLRRRHFMHEVAIDVDQAGAVLGLVDQMIVPDLVVQGCRFGHGREPFGKFFERVARRTREKNR